MASSIIHEMIKVNAQDMKRINHALKVFGIARCIALGEGLSGKDLQIVEVTAVLHDIAIAYCEKTFGKCSGKMQEQYGPQIAKNILESLGTSPEVIKRAEYLIAHHHTYSNIDGIDYRIIIEADFLVNYDEDNINIIAFKTAYSKYFKTATAKSLAKSMFDI